MGRPNIAMLIICNKIYFILALLVISLSIIYIFVTRTFVRVRFNNKNILPIYRTVKFLSYSAEFERTGGISYFDSTYFGNVQRISLHSASHTTYIFVCIYT